MLRPTKKRPASRRVASPHARGNRDWRPAFLASYAICGTVLTAAEAAQISARTVQREKRDNEAFAAEYEEARLAGAMTFEQEAVRRATQGLRKYKFYEGRPIMIPDPSGATVEEGGKQVPAMVPYYEHEYSDTLLLALLKRHFPAEYRENSRLEHSGLNGGPILGGALEAALLKAYGEPTPTNSTQGKSLSENYFHRKIARQNPCLM